MFQHIVKEGKGAFYSTQDSNNCLLCISSASRREERRGEMKAAKAHPHPRGLRGEILVMVIL